MAAILAGMGGRDQLIVASLRDRTAGGVPLAGVALSCGVATVLLAAWAGQMVGAGLSDSAETMLLAIALALVALELAWWRTTREPAEPTRSLGALALVLIASQIGDATRLLIFALAAGSAAPAMTGAGGALGSAAGLMAALAVGRGGMNALPLKRLRRTLAALAFVAALIIGLTARGLIG
ncbi:hypothetical protein [Qipengyuania spongiae]|uniref:GDT1 family protein n=1 Tax=Qipengyuania spongiae TaxID=2909673 RepID=A0ABY5T0K5_9SPHN|nr:hypothetical protein [Qipengyuania spongiae]UVI40335.1 hypothetical protein L1F33_05175 [Qipengyuania spongiae]